MSTKTAISNSINETGVIMDITPETASQWLERNYCSNHEKLARFCEVMRTGIANGKNEMAAAMLNRFLISNAGSGVDHATKYGKIERALLAFLNDEPITRLYCLEGELFLLPEEQAKLC
jgi:hypothetical protein